MSRGKTQGQLPSTYRFKKWKEIGTTRDVYYFLFSAVLDTIHKTQIFEDRMKIVPISSLKENAIAVIYDSSQLFRDLTRLNRK